MPIEYKIDRERKRVCVRIVGKVTKDDFFSYQTEVWSKSEVSGFDELVDMTDAGEIVGATSDSIKLLAGFSSAMDSGHPSRVAIVAPSDLHFGLGRMYEAYRDQPSASRELSVFRTLRDGEKWLSGRAR